MSKTSKTTTENKPPEWAKPLFEQSASVAQDLYNSGAGGNTYQGSTVADLSDTTMQGVNQLAAAGQNWDTSGTRDLYGQIGSAGLSGSAASNYLTDYASGKHLQGDGNPFYRQRMEKDLADTASSVRSFMAGSGRYGSNVSNQALADSLGQIRLQGLENDWNREQQNQFNAVGMLDQQRNLGLDRALSSTNAMANLDQRNFENRLAGAGATMEAGQVLDTQAQKLLDDEVAKFYALDNQDWTRLGMLQAAAAGAAGNYGTQVATQRQPINGLGALGSLFSGKSDLRLKENIRHIGEMNGIPIFEFSYKGQTDRWVGTMAQAIPMHMQAVAMEPDGYLAVDYGRLGFTMARVN